MRCDHTLVIGRQGKTCLQTAAALLARIVKMGKKPLDICHFKMVFGKLVLTLFVYIGIGRDTLTFLTPDDIEDRFDTLKIHRQPLRTIGNLHCNRITGDPPYLLEVGKLRHFHPIKPDFPAQTPGTQGRRLPVILHKTDIMILKLQPQILQGFEIELLDIIRTGFDQCLKLIVGAQPIGIFAVAPIGWSPAWGDISGTPWFAVEASQQCRRVEGSCACRDVVGLYDIAPLLRPELLQLEEKLAESDCVFVHLFDS